MIVSSVIVEDARQADGRRWIAEHHTDQLGVVYEFRYLADADTDTDAILAGRVATVDADLTAGEIASNLALVVTQGAAAVGVLVFNYSTEPQNVAEMASRAGSLAPTEAAQLAAYMAALTDDSLTTLVGMTADQIGVLRGVVSNGDQALAAQGQFVSAIAARLAGA